MSSLRAIVLTCLVLLCVLNACALPPFEIRSAPSGLAATSPDEPSASLKRTSFGLYLLHITIAFSDLKCKINAYTLCLEIRSHLTNKLLQRAYEKGDVTLFIGSL